MITKPNFIMLITFPTQPTLGAENVQQTNYAMKPQRPKIPPQLLMFLITVLSLFLIQQHQQNRELKQRIELLDSQFEIEKQSYQQQQDSIQLIIRGQKKQQKKLKDKITNLEEAKAAINKNHHEKNNSILRIYAVDSLRDEVARHYRP